MGNQQSFARKANFEDIQKITNGKIRGILINTMSFTEQKCLIKKTIPIDEEETIINSHIKGDKQINIIIYDKNSTENKLLKKYKQLIDLGFKNVFIYPGGIFEWLLLQDIYGDTNFPTTSKELDILKYKGKSTLNQLMLE
tara:strand:- start:104 stop:523 length:420 start_codon:yes stop_codon:yes gene_type:complete